MKTIYTKSSFFDNNNFIKLWISDNTKKFLLSVVQEELTIVDIPKFYILKESFSDLEVLEKYGKIKDATLIANEIMSLILKNGIYQEATIKGEGGEFNVWFFEITKIKYYVMCLWDGNEWRCTSNKLDDKRPPWRKDTHIIN